MHSAHLVTHEGFITNTQLLVIIELGIWRRGMTDTKCRVEW